MNTTVLLLNCKQMQLITGYGKKHCYAIIKKIKQKYEREHDDCLVSIEDVSRYYGISEAQILRRIQS